MDISISNSRQNLKKTTKKFHLWQKVDKLNLLASSNPVEKITDANGKVKQEFVDRFNQAVYLNKETGRFAINNDFIPKKCYCERNFIIACFYSRNQCRPR